jgi:AbiV family abortive infection protein
MLTKLKAAEPPKTGKRINTAILDLYDACLENAKSLIVEAELLLSHNYHARAFSLAYTAFEELGKSQLVADYFNQLVAESEFREAFRDHKMKMAYINRYVVIPSTPNDDWLIEYDKQSVSTKLEYRMRSLYVDYGDNFKAKIPNEIIPIDLAESTVKGARKFLKEIIMMSYLTERIGTNSFTK